MIGPLTVASMPTPGMSDPVREQHGLQAGDERGNRNEHKTDSGEQPHVPSVDASRGGQGLTGGAAALKPQRRRAPGALA